MEMGRQYIYSQENKNKEKNTSASDKIQGMDLLKVKGMDSKTVLSYHFIPI